MKTYINQKRSNMAKVSILTVNDVAKKFSVSKATVISWTKLPENPLECFHPSKRVYRFEEKDIIDFLKANRK